MLMLATEISLRKVTYLTSMFWETWAKCLCKFVKQTNLTTKQKDKQKLTKVIIKNNKQTRKVKLSPGKVNWNVWGYLKFRFLGEGNGCICFLLSNIWRLWCRKTVTHILFVYVKVKTIGRSDYMLTHFWC